MTKMRNPLGNALENTLREAASLDEKGVRLEDPHDLFEGRQPSHTELVEESLSFYRERQTSIDHAVDSTLAFLESPHGIAQVKALEASFTSPEPNPLSAELASKILSQPEFDLDLGSVQGVDYFGLGVSAEASAFVGVLAGADVVFDLKDSSEVIGRTWAGGSVKSGISLSSGLELSFWEEQPLSGAIAGWLIDFFIGAFFVRFMHIKQRQQGTKEFKTVGVSIQFPLGIGLPIRRIKEKHPALIGLYAARQKAWKRSKRSTMSVVNQATNVNTIAVEETATMVVTVKNTSGDDIALHKGATMKITMPTYFSDDDVSQMNINYQDWTFQNNGSDMVLTLQSDKTWDSGSEMTFDITNAKSSKTPPVGRQSEPGTVRLVIDDSSFASAIVNVSKFSLVWANSSATLDWKAILNGGDFTLNGPASGDVKAYAQPNNEIVTLTTATQTSTGDVWVLGYIFNYNTAVTNQVIPQVIATWWKQNTPKIGDNVYYGTPASQSGQTTFCYYAGLSQTDDQITIDVTFDS